MSHHVFSGVNFILICFHLLKCLLLCGHVTLCLLGYSVCEAADIKPEETRSLSCL